MGINHFQSDLSAKKLLPLEELTLTTQRCDIKVTNQIPQLVDACQSQTLVLFIGSDLPQPITGLPSRSDLAREMGRRYGVAASSSLAEVAARVSRANSRFEFTDFIRNTLNPIEKSPRPFHQRITDMVKGDDIKIVITIAYDNLLEMAFRQAELRFNRVVRGSDVSFIRPSRPTLIKLYGDIEQPESLVITDQDHSNLLRDRDKEALVDEVRRAFRNNTILFLGYNLADPDFRFLFDQSAQNRFARTAYAVWPGQPEEDVQMWRDRGIVILDKDPFGTLDELTELSVTTQGSDSGLSAPTLPTVPVPADSNASLKSEALLEFDTAAIRQLLFDAFSDDELNTFCFDHFLPVYQNFAYGMSKSDKIQRLLDYCARLGQFERLLDLVKEQNPYQYGRYME